MNKLFISVVLIAFIGLWSCSSGGNQEEVKAIDQVQANNDAQLGLIDADVHNDQTDNLEAMPTYTTAAPGTSQRMERSFENAPPMIPHSTVGLVPITKDMNACTTCHMPAVSVAMKSTAMPASHFTDYRPEVVLNDGEIDIEKSKVVTKVDLDGKLSMTRFNCTQCHVTQANVDVVIQNNFEKVYRDNDLKNSSNLVDNISEGVK